MWRIDQAPEPDPVIEAYKRDVDRTLLRENLRRSVEERIEALMRVQQLAEEFRRAGQRPARLPDFKGVVRVLAKGNVDFIVIGLAAIMQGSARLTFDVEVVYRRSPENIRCLVLALMPYHPYLRGAPLGLPFRWDSATIERGLNFTLTTDIGDVDVLGEIVGGGSYEQLLPQSVPIQVFGVECRCLTLESWVRVKRAAGRPKDLEAIAELEALLEERHRAEGR